MNTLNSEDGFFCGEAGFMDTLSVIEVKTTVQDYLDGRIDRNEAADWALNIIRSKHWDELPDFLSKPVHLLFDLHDAGSSWCPSEEDMQKCLADLKANE